MWSRIWQWINERWPLDAVIRWSLEEEMVGGTSYAYVFGSAVLLTFLLQVVTGVFQFVYMVPTVDHGYDSLNYLRIEVPFGWLIHGLHYWGAVAMLILVGLHMCANFIFGAYKHPRQLTWIIGVLLLLITQAQVFTGPVLPWDERGYWEGEVGTSIVGTTPIIGDFLKRILRGGATMSQLTLSRFFILHAAIIPAILLALIPLHIVAFRRFGVAGPWDEAKRRRIGYFWPDQVFKDGLVFACIVVALIGISVYFPPPIAGPADPLDTSYVPKPEWNFLFLYQALKFFQGPLEPVGTVGIPVFLILLLVLLPFYDRNPERDPARRPYAMSGGGAFVAIVLILAYFGYSSRPGPETGAAAPKQPLPPTTSAAVPAVPVTANIKEGAQLFQTEGCVGCHRIRGVGGTVGPDLSSGVLKGKDREWLITQIRNPKSHFPNTIMPSYTGPSDQEVNTVVDYLLTIAGGGTLAPTAVPVPTAAAIGPPSTKPVKMAVGPAGLAASVIGSPERGVVVFTEVCLSCHGPLGTDNIPNPGSEDGKVPPLNPINRNLFSKDPQTFAENIDRFIQHGSIPQGPNPKFRMLPFGDENSLTQQAISNVEAYVMQLNGMNRAELVHPGVKTHYYFWAMAAVFGIALATLCIWRGKQSRSS
jgi:ubiquinol-cytochrome c reductase cytochrome b subunit